jgi:hypothetical protein
MDGFNSPERVFIELSSVQTRMAFELIKYILVLAQLGYPLNLLKPTSLIFTLCCLPIFIVHFDLLRFDLVRFFIYFHFNR